MVEFWLALKHCDLGKVISISIRDAAPAPDAWVLRSAPARVCVAPEGRRWRVGRHWLSPTFFFSPVHFSHFLPGRGRGPARGRGRGRRGTSGENRLTRPGRLPAAHSRHPRRAGWCDQPPGGGSAPQFPPSSLPRSERAGTCSTAVVYWALLRWLALSGVLFTSIPTSNAMTMVIILVIIIFYHHYLTGRKLPLPLVKRTSVLWLQSFPPLHPNLLHLTASPLPNGVNGLL